MEEVENQMVYIALTAVIAFVAGVGFALLLQRQHFAPLPDRGHRDFMVPDRQALKDLSRVVSSFGLKPRWVINDKRPGGISRIVFGDKMTSFAVLPQHIRDATGNPAANISIVVRDPAAAATEFVTAMHDMGYTATDLGQIDDQVKEGSLRIVTTNAASGWIIVFRKWGPKMGKTPSRYKEGTIQ